MEFFVGNRLTKRAISILHRKSRGEAHENSNLQWVYVSQSGTYKSHHLLRKNMGADTPPAPPTIFKESDVRISLLPEIYHYLP